MKDKFMKNGVFSLEYDKETLRDIVLELQEENIKQKEVIDKAIELRNNFARENAGLIFENNEFIKFMNNLLDILKEVK